MGIGSMTLYEHGPLTEQGENIYEHVIEALQEQKESRESNAKDAAIIARDSASKQMALEEQIEETDTKQIAEMDYAELDSPGPFGPNGLFPDLLPFWRQVGVSCYSDTAERKEEMEKRLRQLEEMVKKMQQMEEK